MNKQKERIGTKDLIVPIRRVTPAGIQCFFGYYDVPAVDLEGQHLCHRVGFRDHIPQSGDAAELGWLKCPPSQDEPTFHRFGRTEAWNFQQGAMLQWVGSSADTCLYNVFENGQYGSCLHNISSGERRMMPLPVANVTRDGSKALCINMSRLYDFRPGYGYEELPDPFRDEAASSRDGIWLMDLSSGSYQLILTLKQIVDFLESAGEQVADRKVVVNHITFNPSASRFLFLLRAFPSPGQRWVTFLVTADTAGENLKNHPVWHYASHYHWRDDDKMLFHARMEAGQDHVGLISDGEGSRRIIDSGFFRRDGHCSYSPDGRWILYDSYQGGPPEHLRDLELYSLDRRRGYTLGRFVSESHPPTGTPIDARCDLHPRWMPDGLSVTFDSIHEGYRAMYWADLREVMIGKEE